MADKYELANQISLLRFELGICRDDYLDNHNAALAMFDKKEAAYCLERAGNIDKLLKHNEYSVEKEK